MEKEHLKAIRMNVEIGNYDRVFCRNCGDEISVYMNEQTRQRYFEVGDICENCDEN